MNEEILVVSCEADTSKPEVMLCLIGEVISEECRNGSPVDFKWDSVQSHWIWFLVVLNPSSKRERK